MDVETEWISVVRRGTGNPTPLCDEVSFSSSTAAFPRELIAGMPGRVDWQWDGRDMVRAQFADDGAFKVAYYGRTQAGRVSTGGLFRTIGRRLKGRVTIARVDGHDVYIRIPQDGASDAQGPSGD